MAKLHLGWIEASLRYAGRFGPREKAVYQDIFEISAPSASRHQDAVARTLEEACGTPLFQRDRRERLTGGKLVLLPDARLPKDAIFNRMPSLDRWLHDAFSGLYFFSAAVPRSDPEPQIIRPIVRAIEDHEPISILYHARSGSRSRTVSPHAVVSAASRLHMRAYDHLSNEYKDFVLSRIQEAHRIFDSSNRYVGNAQDKDWHDFVEVEIKEKEFSDANAQIGVRMEFSLDETGCRIFRLRKALAKYVADIDGWELAAPITVTTV